MNGSIRRSGQMVMISISLAGLMSSHLARGQSQPQSAPNGCQDSGPGGKVNWGDESSPDTKKKCEETLQKKVADTKGAIASLRADPNAEKARDLMAQRDALQKQLDDAVARCNAQKTLELTAQINAFQRQVDDLANSQKEKIQKLEMELDDAQKQLDALHELQNKFEHEALKNGNDVERARAQTSINNLDFNQARKALDGQLTDLLILRGSSGVIGGIGPSGASTDFGVGAELGRITANTANIFSERIISLDLKERAQFQTTTVGGLFADGTIVLGDRSTGLGFEELLLGWHRDVETKRTALRIFSLNVLLSVLPIRDDAEWLKRHLTPFLGGSVDYGWNLLGLPNQTSLWLETGSRL
jgi:hypothetical protein